MPDRKLPTIDEWNNLLTRLQRLERMRVTGGPGAKVARVGDSYYITGDGRPPAPGPSRPEVTVWPTSFDSDTGAGVYKGFLAKLPTSPIDVSADLTDAMCGSASASPCYIFNNSEIGADAGHDLDLGRAYPGAKWIGTAEDGKPIYLISVVTLGCDSGDE